jgi:hypothetical protein
VALLLAAAITPVALYAGGRRAHMPRLTPGVLAGASAGATT